MLNNLKQRKSEGFTIIEVMIVLAIAGLILLIVFLAVPALQRNSRNTTAKNDAAAVAGAINEFISNNDGALPATVSGTGTVTAAATTGGVSATGKVQGSTVVSTVTSSPTAALGAGVIQVRLKYDCTAANNRAVAIYYMQEGATNVNKCLSN